MEKLARKYLTILLKVSVVVQRVAAKSLLLPNKTGPYIRQGKLRYSTKTHPASKQYFKAIMCF